jgi:non-ribosomal peptide synthetase component F
MDEVIGPKMNTLVLRSRCDDRTTLAELLGAVREEIIGAFEHQDTPFEEVVRRLRPARSPGRTPYVDVLVNNVGVAQWSGRLGTARLTPVDFVAAGTEVSKFAVTVTFAERPGTISGTLSYRGDLVDADDAARVAGYIAEVIDRFTEWLDVPAAALGLGSDNAS